jgi:hypothetical protein
MSHWGQFCCLTFKNPFAGSHVAAVMGEDVSEECGRDTLLYC